MMQSGRPSQLQQQLATIRAKRAKKWATAERRRLAKEATGPPVGIHPTSSANRQFLELQMSEDFKVEINEEIDNEAIRMKADELVANLGHTLKGWFSQQSKPWGLMSHDEQQDLCISMHDFARHTVADVVRCVAAEGRKVIVAGCEKVEFVEKGVKATFLAARSSEHRHALADSRGMECLIVVADVEEFNQVGGPPEPDAPKDNQPDLPLYDDKPAIDTDDRPVFDNTRTGRAA